MTLPRSSRKKKTRLAPSRRPPRKRPSQLRAPHKRAAHPRFVELFSLLVLPVLRLLPRREIPLLKRRAFRSWYQPRSRRNTRRFFARLKADPRRRPSFLVLSLYLLDWSPLRPLLLALTTLPSERGQAPFDPLSLFLVCLWKIADHLPWPTVASLLADPQDGASWRTLFGFRLHDTAAESTLRAFRDRLPLALFDLAQACFLRALHRAGLLPPTDRRGYDLAGDGQLHRARSLHRCHHAIASCFAPLPPEGQRPCPAHQESQGRYRCACDTPECRTACALAPRLDPQARFMAYSRRAEGEAAEEDKGEETRQAVFGYCSIAARLLDIRFHHSWNVATSFLPANADEGASFPEHFAATRSNLPVDQIGYVFYDSACGEKDCLDAVYDAGGIPLFDIRADPSDQDLQAWKERGYDDHGHPLCPWGRPLTYQGIHTGRKQPRARWVCAHACRKEPSGEVAECPYLGKKRGFHFYLTRSFRDGSYRLARLVPHGSHRWNRLTGWRNLCESRNSVMERLELKRLPDYGLPHGAFLVCGADLVENLNTLARLVYEATLQDPRFQPLAEDRLWRLLRPSPVARERAGPQPQQRESLLLT